jgi:hypothetical protein
MGNLPAIVASTGGGVEFSLWLMQSPMTRLFAAKYQRDFDGKISIDIADIVKSHLKATLPTNENDLYQSGFEAHFVFKMNEMDDGSAGSDFASDFVVINASPHTLETVEDWCASHFLTDQPVEKRTNYESPEWLTYYDYVGDWVVVGRFYPKEGGVVDMVVKWDEKPGCWSVNVNYARLIPHVARLPHQLKGYFDIILYDGNMNEQCRQRYIYDERTAKEHYYIFANGLGGIDTLIAQGENVLQPELEHNVGRFAKRYKPLDDTEDMQKWQQNTGMLKYRWRNWLFGLIANKQGAAKYDPKDESYHGIVVVSSDINISDKGQLANSQFGYIMESAASGFVEEERCLSQSAADAASELDDLTTEVTVEVVAGETKAVNVTAEKVFVSFPKIAVPALVIYYINGQYEGNFTPGEDESPVVIDLPFGASLHFETDGDIEALTLNWYEGWKEVATYGFVWSELACAVVPDRYAIGWSDHVCAVETAPYTFGWSESRCVLQAGGYEFRWSEDRCVMEYEYKLIWQEIPGDNTNQQLNE